MMKRRTFLAASRALIRGFYIDTFDRVRIEDRVSTRNGSANGQATMGRKWQSWVIADITRVRTLRRASDL